MSVPLEQRGSPVCLYLPLPSPVPCPANRIVSLGDSSGGVVVPSCLCGSRVALESQSLDDPESSMTCPPPRWLPVSCRCGCDSEVLRSRCCGCSRMEPHIISTRSSPVRPRAQCSRKIMSDKGRKCRHTSCQSVSNVDMFRVLKPTPATPLNVIDFLHRDQRTVCVSNCECSDLVRSANGFKCNTYRNRQSGKCHLQIRFSMQRFCSAVLCGLLLLTALRPQFSMAAPVSPSFPAASEDNGDAKPDVNQTLKNLKVQAELTLNHVNSKIRNQFCKDVLYLDRDCSADHNIDIGAFKFIQVPKKLGEHVPSDHFGDKARVDEALQRIHHNFEAYAIALEKLIHNQVDDEKNLNQSYVVLLHHIRQLRDDLGILMRIRGVVPEESITDTDGVVLPNPIKESGHARMVHWGILVEATNGVEYFSQLLKHLGPTYQSTKL